MSVTQKIAGTHLDEIKTNLPEVLKGKTRFLAWLSLFATHVESIEDVMFQVLEERWLDRAVGVQLDILGKIVGQLRGQFDDTTYRIFIRARIRANYSIGKVEDVFDVFDIIANGANTFSYADGGVAEFEMNHVETTLATLGQYYAEFLKVTRSSGVHGYFRYHDAGSDAFRTASSGSVESTDTEGFTQVGNYANMTFQAVGSGRVYVAPDTAHSVFLAVTNNRIYSSPDSITWTLRYTDGTTVILPTNTLYHAISGNGVCILYPPGGGGNSHWSDNLTSWTPAYSWQKVVFGNGLFVAFDSVSLSWSNTGKSDFVAGSISSGTPGRDVCYDSYRNLWYYSSGNSPNGRLFVSSDGKTWTQIFLNASGSYFKIISNQKGVVVFIANNGVWRTTDGYNLVQVSTASTYLTQWGNGPGAGFYQNGRFVRGIFYGAIYSDDEGLTWANFTGETIAGNDEMQDSVISSDDIAIFTYANPATGAIQAKYQSMNQKSTVLQEFTAANNISSCALMDNVLVLGTHNAGVYYGPFSKGGKVIGARSY